MTYDNLSKYSVLFEDFEQIHTRLLNDNKLEELLDVIASLSHGSCYSEINIGRKLFYPQLDSAIEEIARRLRITEEDDHNDEDLQIIIGSEFYTVGGHTPVAKALCRLAKRNLIIATDIFSRNSGINNTLFDSIFSPYPVLAINRNSILAKTFSILSIIKTMKPGKIVCLNHHQDPIPLVAMLAAPKCHKLYYHHCDHQPALGASLDGLIHIDTNTVNASICNLNFRMKNAFFAPIPLEIAAEFEIKFNTLLSLNTVCMGTQNKYLICRDAQLASYPHAIVDLLYKNTGNHFHIGELSPDSLEVIATNLIQNQIDPKRFIYCGAVPKGINLIKQIPNPVFIPSFPFGGGASQIEMMASGVPMLFKKLPSSEEEINLFELQRNGYLPPGCQFWGSSRELEGSLEFLRENYDELSRQSREYFKDSLSIDIFLEKINAEINKYS